MTSRKDAMMISGLSPDEIQEVVARVRRIPAIRQAILFGSRAKGTFKDGSDVDLVVDGIDSTEALRLSASLNEETLLPYHFDVLVYDEIRSAELREHIDRVGIPLLT